MLGLPEINPSPSKIPQTVPNQPDVIASTVVTQLKTLGIDPSRLDDEISGIDSKIRSITSEANKLDTRLRKALNIRYLVEARISEKKKREDDLLVTANKFILLDKHYEANLNRLESIAVAGAAFQVFDSLTCPLCGAESQHQNAEADCGADVNLVIESAKREADKVSILRQELSPTIASLDEELRSVRDELAQQESRLRSLKAIIDNTRSSISDSFSSQYQELLIQRASLANARETLALINTSHLTTAQITNDVKNLPVEHPNTSRDLNDYESMKEFCQAIAHLLEEWRFPLFGSVSYDDRRNDIVVGGKHRSAFGHGSRAILRSAFCLALMDRCAHQNSPHPLFVILDSPLMAYKQGFSKSEEDMTLIASGVNGYFLEYVRGLPLDQQCIIIENTDLPPAFIDWNNATMFGSTPRASRYGFIPSS